MYASIQGADKHVVRPWASITCEGSDRAKSAKSAKSAQAAARAASSLPVVDIAPLRGRQIADVRRVAELLGEAAEGAGFLYISGHGIDPQLQRSVYERALEWFYLPEHEKLKYYIGNSANHRGYVPRSERGEYADEGGARRYEAFDLSLDVSADDPDVGPGRPLLGPNLWPDHPGFKEAVSTYYQKMSELGWLLTAAFEMYLRVPPGSMRRSMRKPTSQLRLLHYLPESCAARNQLAGRAVDMGAHTDYECFTLLHQRDAGLEVLSRQNEWISAPVLDGTFTLNIGDMLETWTNGRFMATLHRVNSGGKERMSLPFFVAADYDAVVRPLDRLVPTGQQPRYPAVVAGHHLMGQLLRDFPYLRARHERGELQLPFRVPKGNPFELRRLASEPAAA